MSRSGGTWSIARVGDDLAAFHGTDPAPTRSATVVTAPRPTLVLGSTQSEADVDRRVAGALGIDIVRRRSGGGAVLLMPGEFAWIDVVVPAGDPLWSDDVGAAMAWVGEMWQHALLAVGVRGTVHAGAMVHGQWSRQVCFAGCGSGEVVAVPGDAGKLVGISQRRTRTWARFQTMCHVRWRPEIVRALVAPPRPGAAQTAAMAAAVPCAVDDLVAAVLAHLPG